MNLIDDLFKGLIILGVLGMGSDLLDMKLLSKNAAKAHQGKGFHFREWNSRLYRKYPANKTHKHDKSLNLLKKR